MESEDNKYVGVYKFYTIMSDPPYQELYSYPLEKEWNDAVVQINSFKSTKTILQTSMHMMP